jgi:hypothetical protein
MPKLVITYTDPAQLGLLQNKLVDAQDAENEVARLTAAGCKVVPPAEIKPEWTGRPPNKFT